MKKLILISFLLVVSLGFSHNAGAATWTFDGDTTGSIPNGWTVDYGPPEVVIEVDESVYYGSSGKSVHFSDNTGSSGSNISTDVGAMTNVSLDYYMLSQDANDEGAFVELWGDAGSDYSISFGNAAGGGSAGYIGIFGPSGWIQPNFLPYTTNTWYHVTRTLNLNGDGSSSGTFYVEEAGNPGNSNSYSVGSYDANTYISDIHIWTSGSQGADAYIDELTVVPEPVSSLLFLTGGTLLAGRRFTKRKKIA